MDKYNKNGWIQVAYNDAIDKISTNNKKVKQKEYISDGKYPVIDQGQDFIGGYTNDESKLLDCTLPALVFGDHTKIVKLVNYKFAPGADGIKVVVPRKFFNAKLFEFFTKILALKISDKGYARHFQYIEKSKIPLPPPPEQQAIVSKIEQLFSDLDNGIEHFKKAQAQLKIYRQAVLKNACEGELVPTEAELARNEGRDYEPADVLLARILEERRKKWNGKGKYKEPAAADTSGLLELPEGWVWTSFNSLLIEHLRNGHSAKSSSDENGIRTLTLSAVTQRDFSEKNIKITVADPKRVKDLWLKHGDILIERSNTIEYVGLSAIYLGKDDFAVFPDLLIRARVSPSFLIPQFVDYFLRTPFARIYFKSKAQGISGNMPKINQTTIERLPIPLLPLTEQRRIVTEVERRISIGDKLETTIAESLQKAESLRQSILKKAFEGKLLNEKELEEARNAPDWEPAEKLLERIRQEKQIKENNNKPTRRKTYG